MFGISEMTRVLPLVAGGLSRQRGFTLQILNRAMGLREECLVTAEHPDQRPRLDLVVPLTLALVMLASAFLPGGWPWPVATGVLTLVLVGKFSLYHRNTKEWHACEHACTMLIIERQPIAYPALRSMPQTLLYCGSIKGGLRVMLVTAIFMPSPWRWYALVPAICSLVWHHGMHHEWRQYRAADRLFWVCAVIGIPAILGALAIQRLCFLRRPKRWQWDAAIEELVRLDRENQLLFHVPADWKAPEGAIPIIRKIYPPSSPATR